VDKRLGRSPRRRRLWLITIGAAAIVVLVGGGVALLTRGDSSGGVAFEDQFDGSLAAGWEWEAEDPDHWSLTAAPGSLQITALAESRNVLLRDAPDEPYELTTRVRFDPSTNYQFAGLIITGTDPGDVLQVGQAFCQGQPHCVGNGVYADVKVDDKPVEDGNVGAPLARDPEALYLRVVADGDEYTASFSEDGTTWTHLASRTLSIGDPRVGLVAHQALSGTADARFDYVTIREPERP
jgi:hypothetical protein